MNTDRTSSMPPDRCKNSMSARLEELSEQFSQEDIEILTSAYLKEIGHGPTENVLPDRSRLRMRACRVDRRKSGRAP